MTVTLEPDAHTDAQIVYWHRHLPPLEAERVAEHSVEARSSRVQGTFAHRDDVWDRCNDELMANVNRQLVHDVTRLGAHYAHVYKETITPKHDDATGEAWLQGEFTCTLSRRPAATP